MSNLLTGNRLFQEIYLVMYPHGVDPLQFTGPVLSLVVGDICTEEIDGLKVRKITGVTGKYVEES